MTSNNHRQAGNGQDPRDRRTAKPSDATPATHAPTPGGVSKRHYPFHCKEPMFLAGPETSDLGLAGTADHSSDGPLARVLRCRCGQMDAPAAAPDPGQLHRTGRTP